MKPVGTLWVTSRHSVPVYSQDDAPETVYDVPSRLAEVENILSSPAKVKRKSADELRNLVSSHAILVSLNAAGCKQYPAIRENISSSQPDASKPVGFVWDIDLGASQRDAVENVFRHVFRPADDSTWSVNALARNPEGKVTPVQLKAVDYIDHFLVTATQGELNDGNG